MSMQVRLSVLLVTLSACGVSEGGETGTGEAQAALRQESAYDATRAGSGGAAVAGASGNSRERCVNGDRRHCWHTAVKVDDADGDTQSCSVGMDDSGNATAVWQGLTGPYYVLWGNRHTAGSWLGASELKSYPDRTVDRAYVTVGSNTRRALAVWSEPAGSIESIVFDNTWQTPIVAQPGGGLSFSMGPVVGHPNGSTMLMTTTVHQGFSIASLLYANNVWGTTLSVPPGPAMGPSSALGISVALTASTATRGSVDATAVRIQDDGLTGAKLVANQFVAATGWATATVLRPAGGGSFGAAKLSAAPYSRKTLAVWSEFSDTTNSTGTMVARTYDATKGWGALTKISDQVDANNSLQLATDDNGNVLAVWQRADTKPASIWSMHFDARSSKWSAPSQIDRSAGTDAVAPVLALEHQGGTAVVVWTVHGAADQIWATRYAPRDGWNTPTRISQDGAHAATTPCVAASTHGDAIALWQQSDGTQVNIMSSSFE